eukprot:TRINITY_DN2862_c0_g1_i1.p1 TRINITY_DN2862_c0_g1~~TRINITY_DN2862_c0_g1_i1.p1  ORF type:complete len:235 (-),score=4.50 TRINITY_DN2862_c0_g1_i1:32-709(-)
MAKYAMNWFRLTGDFLHLLSFFVLIWKIKTQKDHARGISLKTQVLYLILFVARYLDLPYNIYYHRWYLVFMKMIFIGGTCYLIYLIYFQYKNSYSKNADSFPAHWLVLGAAILGIVLPLKYTPFEMSWAFSIYLETVAIYPQIGLLRNMDGSVEALTSHYIICLGGYRALYLINWIYRIMYEVYYRDYLTWVCGLVQTVLYADLFYLYFKSQVTGEEMVLPIVDV